MSGYRKFSDARQSRGYAFRTTKQALAEPNGHRTSGTLGALGALDGQYPQTQKIEQCASLVPPDGRWDQSFETLSCLVTDAEPTSTASEGLPIGGRAHQPGVRAESVVSIEEDKKPGWFPPKPAKAPKLGWGLAEEERAVIIQESGIPSAWAEGLARLDPNEATGRHAARALATLC